MRHISWIFLIFSLSVCLVSCGDNSATADEVTFELGSPDAVEDTETEVVIERDYSADLEFLLEAVESEPDSPDARFVYMTGLVRAGEFKDALEQCRILDEIDTDRVFTNATYLNFGTIVLENIPLDDPERDALVNEAVDFLWVGLGLEPESVPSHRVIGLLLFESGDYDKALHHLSIALSSSEIGYNARIKMAEIYIERNDLYKAKEHLEVALEIAVEAEDSNAVRTINSMLSGIE